jgi:cellulose synthase/poly-beta-1,6-N-acetylglucosamine synthase-like glycosyltransferase
MTTHDLFLVLYKGAFIPVCIGSGVFFLLAVISLLVDRSRGSRAPKNKLTEYPFITVQLPSYNDPVAVRCVEACLNFDYPKDRYDIMILDDSTDKATASLLEDMARRHPDRIRFFHRDNRAGYKPGALKAWMPYVRGKLVVIFDADFVPHPNFLKNIAQPFEDPQVAIVQGRQGSFLNGSQNLVTRFASYLLGLQHYILMPINQCCNAVFFCGTGGALRKRAIEAVGGWNTTSITEDSDLSVRLLVKGYRSVYLPFDTPSELPVTLKAFLRQQMRWCFGNARVFFDHAWQILGRGPLSLAQRIMISFMTIGSLIAPIVILFTIAGSLAWITGDPRPFTMDDVLEVLTTVLLTSGFLIMGLVMLVKRGSQAQFPRFVAAAVSLGYVLTCALTVAVYKAAFRKDKPLFAQKTSWICTPKSGNEQYGQSGL